MENVDKNKIEVVGVRFKRAGKIHNYLPKGQSYQVGDNVIVETLSEIEFGKIEKDNHYIEETQDTQSLKNIIRKATEKDIEQKNKNRIKEIEALVICLRKIKKHKLEMKLIDVELTFDSKKIIFYFTADGRIDFRALVKDLAYIFKIRIELRQIGVRDEAKIKNGIGICGRTLCCSTFLNEFQSVSIKMAKEQNLSLNPIKISGSCGRLMCCLKYEEETYRHLNKNLPKEGDLVLTNDGIGVVLAVNILQQLVKVAVRVNDYEEPTVNFYDADEVKLQLKKQEDTSDDEKICKELEDILD